MPQSVGNVKARREILKRHGIPERAKVSRQRRSIIKYILLAQQRHDPTVILINLAPYVDLRVSIALIQPCPPETIERVAVVALHRNGNRRKMACYRRLLIFIAGNFILVIAERSEEHTSELQSRENLVCRLLLE